MICLKKIEYKYLMLLILISVAFSLWFYVDLTSQERFALAHGYGSISQIKEMGGILGIALAFIASFLYHRDKKTPASLLLTAGIGLLVARGLLHSTHMVNAMEQNTVLFEAIFEGENHFLLSVLDVAGAVILSLGLVRLSKWRKVQNKILVPVILVELGLMALVLSKTNADTMLLLNNMVVSHGKSLLSVTIATMPIIAFFVLAYLASKAYSENDSDFHRLLFLGLGFIFLRSLVHGVHTVFGLETHFFQSGFDLLGGGILGIAFYKEIDKEKNPATNIWILSIMVLAFAVTYAIFTFFKIR